MGHSQNERQLQEWEKPESYHLGWRKNSSGMKPVLAVIAFLSAVSGVFAMFEDKRPVGAFFEQFVASFLHIVVLFGAMWFGAWLGVVAYEKSGFKVLGWMVGILAVFGVSFGSMFLIEKIPGVGWRYDLLLSSEDDF
jgi:hypothetical protein